MARESFDELLQRRVSARSIINNPKRYAQSQVDSAKTSLNILNRQIALRKVGRFFTWPVRKLRRKPR